MCLYSYSNELEELKNKNKNKKFITCYKILTHTDFGVLQTPYRCAEVRPKKGEIFKSDITKEKIKEYKEEFLVYNQDYQVTKGIHVFTDLEYAKLVVLRNVVIWRLKCNMRDILGYSRWCNSAAFTKIIWDKVLNVSNTKTD
jgi:hypothetical protein